MLFFFIFNMPVSEIFFSQPDIFVLFTLLLIPALYLFYRLKFLSPNGAAAAFLLGIIIFGLGGWKYLLPMSAFFILSSIVSGLGKSRKKETESVFEKTGRRDAGQVAANGGVAALIAVLQIVFHDLDLYPAYIGSIAAVTADTWGTEIGILLQGRTILLAGMKRAEPGTNGGISAEGLLAGAAGGFVIALTGNPWLSGNNVFTTVVFAAVIGSLIDSVLGCTVQARFRCRACGRNTERREHCGKPTEFAGGFNWINNDIVNFTCALSGGFVTFLLL